MISVFVVIIVLLSLGLLTYYGGRSLKTIMIIGLCSLLGTFIFHGIEYVSAPERGKGEIVMWSPMSIPMLALILYVIMSLGVIIYRIFAWAISIHDKRLK